MYLNFYQLEKKPFSLAPDPDFLFLSQQHKDALGAIICGINERQGFVSVVGEVGTGKTTIIKSYLQQSDRESVLPVFIFNARITFSELLTTYLQEIGVTKDLVQGCQSVNELVQLAHQTMLDLTKNGKNLVLIIDEAQNMPNETLASLCILSNFETTKNKLIQIILVGQPELKKKLELGELRQLQQRILYKAEIWPLSKQESYQYFYHRLNLAAKGAQPIFSAAAVRRIIRRARGVPRVLNALSENALIAGYGSQTRPISAKLVKQVIADYEGVKVTKKMTFARLAIPAICVLLGASLVAGYTQFVPEVTPADGLGKEVSNETSLEVMQERSLALLDPEGPVQAVAAGKVIPSLPVNEKQISSHLRVVRRGDTLSQLCVDSYGFYNLRVHLWLKRQNPHIANLEAIEQGDMVYFPPMEPAIVKQMHELHPRVDRPRKVVIK